MEVVLCTLKTVVTNTVCYNQEPTKVGSYPVCLLDLRALLSPMNKPRQTCLLAVKGGQAPAWRIELFISTSHFRKDQVLSVCMLEGWLLGLLGFAL